MLQTKNVLYMLQTDRLTNKILYMLQMDRMTKNVLYMLQTDRLKEGYTSDVWKTILYFWANVGPLTLVFKKSHIIEFIIYKLLS